MSIRYNPFTSSLDFTGSGAVYTADGQGIELSAGEFRLELDSTTLSKSASGLKVATGGIANNEIAVAAAIAVSKLAALTASRAVVSDASGFVSASSVTSAELGYVSGVTSAIQTQLGNKLATSLKGAVNGLAELDAGGKVPVAQLPAVSITNTFVVASQVAMLALTAETGDVAVRTDLNKSYILQGSDPTVLGDWQELLTPTDAVLSVNSLTGAVVLDTDDVSDSGATNKYFSNELAQDAVGGMVANSLKVSLTYVDGTPSLTADIVSGSLVNTDISGSAAIAESKLSLTYSTSSLNTAVGTAQTTANSAQSTANAALPSASFTDAAVTGKLITGYVSGAGTVAATDTILQAINKLNGNTATKVTIVTGDIVPTSFAGADNQGAAADITGLAFANGVVRSFEAQVSVTLIATSSKYEVIKLSGIQRGADWAMSNTSTGDASGIVFSITNAGQIQYTSPNSAGFVSLTFKFRAETLPV